MARYPAETWFDYANVKGIGPTTIQSIEEFTEKDDPFDIELTGRLLDEIRHGISKRWTAFRGIPRPTHRSHEIPRGEAKDTKVVWMGVVRKIEYKDLIEDERAQTGDSVEDILKRTRDPHLLKSCTLHCYDDGDDEVYLRINRWDFPRFRERVERIVTGEDVVICTGLKRRGGFGVSLAVRNLIVLQQQDEEEEEA